MQIGILSNLCTPSLLHVLTPSQYIYIYETTKQSTLLSGKRATGRRKHKGRNREQTSQVAVIVHENSTSSLFKHPIQGGNTHAKLTCPLTSELYRELDTFKGGDRTCSCRRKVVQLCRREAEWLPKISDGYRWMRFKNILEYFISPFYVPSIHSFISIFSWASNFLRNCTRNEIRETIGDPHNASFALG